MQTSGLSYYLLLFLCLWGCSQEKKQLKKGDKDSLGAIDTTARPMNYRSSADISSYKTKVLNKGDTIAYKELRTAFLNVPPEDFIFWAKYMADVYDYPPAYVDYASNVALVYVNKGIGLGDINVRVKTELELYFKKAAEKGLSGYKLSDFFEELIITKNLPSK